MVRITKQQSVNFGTDEGGQGPIARVGVHAKIEEGDNVDEALDQVFSAVNEQQNRARYSRSFDQQMDALCDRAVDFIRSVQAYARADREDGGIPLTEDMISAATLHDERGALELIALAELFAELHKNTLSHGSYLLGQGEVMPEPYKSWVVERGQFITTEGVDDYEITVTLREDADKSVRDMWARP